LISTFDEVNKLAGEISVNIFNIKSEYDKKTINISMKDDNDNNNDNNKDLSLGYIEQVS